METFLVSAVEEMIERRNERRERRERSRVPAFELLEEGRPEVKEVAVALSVLHLPEERFAE